VLCTGRVPLPEQLAVSLVGVEQSQYDNPALTTHRRLGETMGLRNQ